MVVLIAVMSVQGIMNLQVQFVRALFFHSLSSIYALHLRTVHNTPGEFGNGGLTLKTHQMFSVHTTPRNLKMKFHSENTSNVFRPHYAAGEI